MASGGKKCSLTLSALTTRSEQRLWPNTNINNNNILESAAEKILHFFSDRSLIIALLVTNSLFSCCWDLFDELFNMPTKNIVPVRVVESIDKRLMTADRLSESKLYLGKSTLHMGQLCPCLCLKTKLFYLLCYMLAFSVCWRWFKRCKEKDITCNHSDGAL